MLFGFPWYLVALPATPQKGRTRTWFGTTYIIQAAAFFSLACCCSVSFPFCCFAAGLFLSTKVEVSRMSRDDDPTNTPNVPSTKAHLCPTSSHTESARGVSVNTTVCTAPTASCTLVNAFNCFGGYSAAAGNPR